MDNVPQPDPASETMECPHCGAEVTYSSSATSARCPACGRSVPVPVHHIPHVVSAPVEQPNVYPDLGALIRRRVVVLLAPFIALIIVMAIVLVGLSVALPKIFPPELDRAITDAATSMPEPTRVPSTKMPAPTATPAALETLLSFGEKGMGVGQFDDANVVVPDNAGHIYVSERHGGRIQVFDETGKFLNQWFVANVKPKTLITSLAADGKGNLLVATDDEVLTRYEGQTGKLLNQVQYPGGPGFTKIALMPNGGLAAIHSVDSGIATAPHEGVEDDLVIFDAQGAVTHVIAQVVSSQTDEAEINLQIAVDGRNNIYIMGTYYTHEIYKFSPEGKFITRIGSPDDLKDAYSFAIDSQGRIYANASETILVYDETGRKVDAYAPGPSIYSPIFDAHDNLWVISENTSVKKLKLLKQ